ncbi:MAG TPA: ATP-binding protein [Candidatus Paceibacterota bacterium]|nr:ATP-binding protein [Candidatus Paceibacterota bacterium]
MLSLLCTDASPVFFGLLDFSIAPPLLYYAYIPIMLFSLWFALRTLYYNRHERIAQLFALLAFALVFLSGTSLLAWIAAPVVLVQLAWQSWGVASAFMSLATVLFVYHLLHGETMPTLARRFFLVAILPIIILAPSTYNVESFDISTCEAVQGNALLVYTYIYEAFALIGVGFVLVRAFMRSPKIQMLHGKAVIIALSAFAFLAVFLLTTLLGDVIGDYRFELIAPIGAVLFLAGVSYIAVNDKRFSIHMLGAEMLVIALVMVLAGILFIQDIDYVHRVTYVSLVLVTVIGLVLMRSVRNEVKQREEIEELATRLKEVNRVMSHDVKGTLGKHAMLFRALFEGEFGPVPEQAKGFIEQSAKDAMRLIDSIMLILKSGSELVFHSTKFDIAAMVKEVVAGVDPDAVKKGLSLNLDIAHDGPLMVNLDQAYIKLHVIQNLVANAVNYTLSGGVYVRLEQKDPGHILFSVRDTGVGITPEDAPKMFKEGGHGAHSTEVNVHSTGYGLFSAKRVVDACCGRIWFESEGIPGKGTTFFVELPAGDMPCEVKPEEEKE